MFKPTRILILLSIPVLLLQGCRGSDITEADMQGKKMFYQVVSNYNTDNYSESELNQITHDSLFLENIKKFNEELNSTEDINFYDMKHEAVEFIGPWNKPKDLANGYGNKDLTDQQVIVDDKAEYITPVDAFILNKRTQDKLGWDFFSEDNFLYNDELPIVLGHGFKEYYNIGDIIPVLYLREAFNGRIIGFFDEDLKFDTYFHCDSYSTIIIPYMDKLENRDDYDDKETFLNTYYLFKNLGYIYVENTKDFKSNKEKVEKLAQKYNLDFTALRGY